MFNVHSFCFVPVPPSGRYARPENWHEAEPMYIKHSVSLIGTGGLTYLSKGENTSEAEAMYIKHSVS
jgi:hypothetical protein